jgi:hypothetical protein
MAVKGALKPMHQLPIRGGLARHGDHDAVHLAPVALDQAQDLFAQGLQGGNESVGDVADGEVHGG